MEASRKLILETKDSVTHWCETEVGSSPQWCSLYRFNIRNPTRLPIRSVTIGYDYYGVCAEQTARTKTFTVNLKSDEEHESLIEWFVPSGPTCSKVLDVEFDKTFIPEQC
jgi:hypothetical protein